MKVIVHTDSERFPTQTLSNVSAEAYHNTDSNVFSVQNESGESLVVPWSNVSSILYVKEAPNA